MDNPYPLYCSHVLQSEGVHVEWTPISLFTVYSVCQQRRDTPGTPHILQFAFSVRKSQPRLRKFELGLQGEEVVVYLHAIWTRLG